MKQEKKYNQQSHVKSTQGYFRFINIDRTKQ